MSGSSGTRPPLRLVSGGRPADDLSGVARSGEEPWGELLRRAAAAAGVDASQLAETFQAAKKPPRAEQADVPVDPIVHTQRVDDEGRGGPAVPAGSIFEGVLGAAPSPTPAAVVASMGPPTAAVSNPSEATKTSQARDKTRRRAKKRDKRRGRRREHSQERLEALREQMFEGQVCDVPPFPELKPEARAASLAVMRDGTGRKACELLSKLPLGQQLALLGGAYAVLDKIKARRSYSITREDVAAGKLPDDPRELAQAISTVREVVAPSPWFRREVCVAWAMWSHRNRLSEEGRKAWRGGVYTVEGFCEAALSWLVPRADGTQWSRTALFRRDGPFGLLGSETKALGRKVTTHGGMGLFKRWQPPHMVATYKGPWRTNAAGARERFALAQHRYDPEMSGRTAMSLVRRARGKLRELARLVVSALTPWIKLPEKRPRVVARRDEDAVLTAESVAVAAQPARAPP